MYKDLPEQCMSNQWKEKPKKIFSAILEHNVLVAPAGIVFPTRVPWDRFCGEESDPLLLLLKLFFSLFNTKSQKQEDSVHSREEGKLRDHPAPPSLAGLLQLGVLERYIAKRSWAMKDCSLNLTFQTHLAFLHTNVLWLTMQKFIEQNWNV